MISLAMVPREILGQGDTGSSSHMKQRAIRSRRATRSRESMRRYIGRTRHLFSQPRRSPPPCGIGITSSAGGAALFSVRDGGK